jgi:hypothetical protein
MGGVYLWLVRVYECERYGYGVVEWKERRDLDRTFKNKVDAMQYVLRIRQHEDFDAKLVKWYGN